MWLFTALRARAGSASGSMPRTRRRGWRMIQWTSGLAHFGYFKRMPV